MSNLATLCHDEASQTWTAVYNGEILAKSVGGESSKKYIIERVTGGRMTRCIKLGVTGFSNVGDSLAQSPSILEGEPGIGQTFGIGKPFVPPLKKVKANNNLTVEERYELLDETVRILATSPGIRALIVTGEGSVGKTFHTKEVLRNLGLKSTEEAFNIAHTLLPEEQIVADMIMKRLDECRQVAIDYYKKNGLPPLDGEKKKKKEKPKAKDEESEDDADEPEVEEEEVDEREFKLEIGDVNFTKLHTSRDIKDRMSGGYCSGNNYAFNIKLAMQDPEYYYRVVVPHEMAHQIQHIVYPDAKNVKEGHGKEWCIVMKEVFGLSPDRYHTLSTVDVKLAPDLAGDYHYVKGYSSAKGLFRMLFENKKKIVVLDDCDAAWQNEFGANLLKAALDSDDERYITWNVEQKGNDDLPKRFLFEGKVIFISNVKSEDFPRPLITRALRCDVELTIKERFERMEQILYTEKFAPNVPHATRKLAFDFLYENREIAEEISTRALLNVCEVAHTGSKLWQRIALSNIT